MLSDALESLQSNSIYFLQSTYVGCYVIVLLTIYDVILSPQFLGNKCRWRMLKQSIPGPSSEEERPGIEGEQNAVATELSDHLHAR